ncbi:MAG: hypothetical protein EBV24_00475 [Actinobacteria bacterium]|nr:hypothetical protein [Actinomycetota bacterium]
MQVPQYGAQNQKATGAPLYRDPKSPAGDTGAAVVVDTAGVDAFDVDDSNGDASRLVTADASLFGVESSAHPAAKRHATRTTTNERFTIRAVLVATP